MRSLTHVVLLVVFAACIYIAEGQRQYSAEDQARREEMLREVNQAKNAMYAASGLDPPKDYYFTLKRVELKEIPSHNVRIGDKLHFSWDDGEEHNLHHFPNKEAFDKCVFSPLQNAEIVETLLVAKNESWVPDYASPAFFVGSKMPGDCKRRKNGYYMVFNIESPHMQKVREMGKKRRERERERGEEL